MKITWLGLIVVLLGFALPRPTLAAGVVGDGTPESCTEAALSAALAGGGNVTFSCGGSPLTITVTSPKMILTTTVIDGGNLITLSGGGTTTVLEMTDYLPLLTIRNLTIADGYAVPAPPQGVCNGGACGGGVRGHYRASLTVENVRFENNIAASNFVNDDLNLDFGGGAIYMHSGVLTLSNSVFVNNQSLEGAGAAIHLLHSNSIVTDTVFDHNTSTYYGGAIYTDGVLNSAANLSALDGFNTYIRTTFSNNTGEGQGGAVFNYMYVAKHPNTLITYDNAIFTNNSVTPDRLTHAFGGALRVGNGPVQIMNSTFSGNTAERQGGAIWSGELASVTVTNSTFSGNSALSTTEGFGGAISIANSRGFTFNNVTVSNNFAGSVGGGLSGGASNVVLKNTIVAFNSAPGATNKSLNCSATYGNGGNNIQSPPAIVGERDCVVGITYANPLLGPLENNGGFTQTQALLMGSPAIDKGNNATCAMTDQRGEYRNIDGDWSGVAECDIGAYEYREFDNPAAPEAAPQRNPSDVATPMVTWTPISWAAAYQIQIAIRSNFVAESIVMETAPLPATPYAAALPTLPNGTYFWRIRGQDANGRWGNWSAGDSFLIMPP